MNFLSIIGIITIITGVVWFWQIYFKSNVHLNLTIRSKDDNSDANPKPVISKPVKTTLVSSTYEDLVGSVANVSSLSTQNNDQNQDGFEESIDTDEESESVYHSQHTNQQQMVTFTDPFAGDDSLTSSREETIDEDQDPELDDDDGYINMIYDQADQVGEDEDEDELPSFDELNERPADSPIRINSFQRLGISTDDINRAIETNSIDSIYQRVLSLASQIERDILQLQAYQDQQLQQAISYSKGINENEGGLGAMIGNYSETDPSTDTYQTLFPIEGIADEDVVTMSLDELVAMNNENQRGIPLNGYLQSIGITSSLSYELVQSIESNLPVNEVLRRGRQLTKAIKQYNLGSDSNAFLAVTSQLNKLQPSQITGQFDDLIRGIEVSFGMAETEDTDPLEDEVEE